MGLITSPLLNYTMGAQYKTNKKEIGKWDFLERKEAKEQKPIEEVMAQNVFGKKHYCPGKRLIIVFKEKGRRKVGFFNGSFSSNRKKVPIF